MLYVVDTSVFLSDPHSLERLNTQDIVIPLVVLTELESKRNDPELGYAARTALRKLEEYRKSQSLTDPIPTGNGGSITVEMNHIDSSVLPSAFQGTENDVRILSVAANLQKEGKAVTLLSKDLPLRLRASVIGVEASEGWEQEEDVSLDMKVEEVTGFEIDEIYNYDHLTPLFRHPVNTGVILKAGTSSALGRVRYDGKVQLIKEKQIFDVRGRSAEQRLAIDVLTDDSIGIVSLGGRAGTGKTLLALAAGLESVVNNREKKKVIVFRNLYPVGGQDLGFLPGSAEEKMSPWATAVEDALESICQQEVIDYVIENELLQILPLTHLRGRTIKDAYIIVDEAQNLDKSVLLTALTRVGENTKIVLTHDVDQRDNLRVGKYDGVNSIIKKLIGSPLFAHVNLRKSERSRVAQLAAEMLAS